MTKSKKFDCVGLMRRLRDQLDEELSPMSADERRRYIHNRAASDPIGAQLERKQDKVGKKVES